MTLRKKTVYVIIILVTIICLLGLVELLMKFGYFAPSFIYPATRSDFKMMFDRRLQFKIKPHSGKEINNYGFRDGNFQKDKGSKKRVLFYGDSFVMGMNVPFADTMPKALERKLADNYEVYNLGVIGYGPDQSWLHFKDTGLSLKPDMVVLAIYPTNDFNDMVNHNLFFIDEANGSIQYNQNNTAATIMSNSDLLYLYNFILMEYLHKNTALTRLFLTIRGGWDYDFMTGADTVRDKSDFMRALLRDFKKLCDKNNVKFLIVIIPNIANIEMKEVYEERKISKDKYFANEDVVKSICNLESIDCINVYEDFIGKRHDRLLFDHKDWHLSSYGYNRVSELIYSYMQTHP